MYCHTLWWLTKQGVVHFIYFMSLRISKLLRVVVIWLSPEVSGYMNGICFFGPKAQCWDRQGHSGPKKRKKK